MTNIPLSEFMDKVRINEPEIYAAAMEVKKEILLPLELKSLREGLGVTQVELAKAMKLKQSLITRLEKKAHNAKLSTIKAYLIALDCSVSLQVTLPDGRLKTMEI